MTILTDDYLKAHAWQMARANSFVAAPAMRFRDRGIVGGFISKWERVWELRDGKLLLQDISGVTSTCFEVTDQDETGVRELRGYSKIATDVEHVLTRIEMPTLDPTPERNPEDVASIGVIRNARRGARKNLVIVRAGTASLHRQWPRYISAEDRNWDLCVSWYSTNLPEDLGDCEYFFHQSRDHKFCAIANLLINQPHLLEYERFWFPDDDLEISWRDINRLFNIFRRTVLDLAQPALSRNSHSYVNHEVTGQSQEHHLRYCDFIELMCPVFSQELLKICIPAFRGTTWAYCLDHVWGGLQGRVPGRMAVIDDVVVAHARPMGFNYDGAQAMDEGNRLAGLYCIEGSYTEHGGIGRRGCML